MILLLYAILVVPCTSWCPIGYQGDVKNGTDDQHKDKTKGADSDKVKERLNGLFSLVQGLGGTAVVRTYIDQLAQVLSALIGWSRIEQCTNGKGQAAHGTSKCQNGGGKGGSSTCKYLDEVTRNGSCATCGCIKGGTSSHLGRGCTRCKDGGGSDCKCTTGGTCEGTDKCKCALAGKCCKCCCTNCTGKCSDSCICHKYGYMSAYPHQSNLLSISFVEDRRVDVRPYWKDLTDPRGFCPGSASERRAKCARILLGSVCLIWSGITYMHWTGKYYKGSPYWNNHILDGSGLDDGTLSQWLQALGFPREMLNNSGPQNRLDKVITDEFRDKLFLGFGNTSGVHIPGNYNFAGWLHQVDKGAFDSEVFRGNGKDNSNDQHKRGSLFKLYILSCAYFTGLQKKTTPKADNRTPKTIREILYWLSALPYSPAYRDVLTHAKDKLEKVLKKPEDTASTSTSVNEQKRLSFKQTDRWHPINVEKVDLYAHFQAVTQYCPLVLIGIQGGLHSTKGTDSPAIHALYANTACGFTYPAVPIQAYNQVVHYIRALFYQLYFLRKQCAVKVALGGKWRECRYGNGVVSKGVISWMCLGCNPMEHDRHYRVGEMKKGLDGVPKGTSGEIIEKLKVLLKAIGDVVVQLGNAQEALERRKGEEITKVKVALGVAKGELEKAKEKLNGDGLEGKLTKAKTKLGELTGNGRSNGKLGDVIGGSGLGAAEHPKNGIVEVDPGKNKISAAINGVRKALDELKKGVEGLKKEKENEIMCGLSEVFGVPVEDNELEKVLQQGLSHEYTTLLQAIDKLLSICNSPKCPGCDSHSTKCGQKGTPIMCKECGSMTTTGVPSPLQAFLEDRLPGFSCQEVPNTENPEYPPAASHLGHCGGSGQCCPLPMGFRNQFYKGSISDCTGKRLYGILYFFSNENMMESCVYRLVRITSALSATTPQVLGDVFGFFRGGVGNKEQGKPQKGPDEKSCEHTGNPSDTSEANKKNYYCGWCASGLRDVVKDIEWIPNGTEDGGKYRTSVGTALINIKGDKGTAVPQSSNGATTSSNLSTLTTPFLSPLTGELYTAVSATFGGTYLSWVLYLSDALEGGLKSLSEAFQQIECRGCRECDPNKCKKGSHGDKGTAQCQCQSIVSCTGVLPVLYRHGFSYGNPFNLEGFQQSGKEKGDYSITKRSDETTKHCHEFLESLNQVIKQKEAEKETSQNQDKHPLSNLLSQVGQLQYDIRLPWIFVLTLAWLAAVLYLAFGAIWPLDWTHMRSHWLRGGEHQWQCMWYKVMTGRKGVELMEYFGRK